MALIIARRPHVWLVALAAAALTGCSPSTGTATSPVQTATVTSTPGAAPATAPAPQGAPATVTVVAPPPVTVTAVPPPPGGPVTQQSVADGPFQSPSGNIRCAMAMYQAGGHTVRCEVGSHDWVATQPVGCELNWGDRVALEEAAPATFDCYGQNMRPVTHTLEFGQVQKLGPLSCTSEPAGVTCTDNNSGHYFFVSRQTVHLG